MYVALVRIAENTTKLVKMKDQRIPRLADLTMRPALQGRKTVGNLDSHTNGLRFSTTKTNDVVDIMYVRGGVGRTQDTP